MCCEGRGVETRFTCSCIVRNWCGDGALVTTSCLTHDHMDWSPASSSVGGISQARILEWVAISFSRGSSWLRDQTWVSWIAGRFFTAEPPGKLCEELRLNKLLVCEIRWLLPHDDLLSIFTLNCVIQKFRLI